MEWISVKDRLPEIKPVDSIEVIAKCSLASYVLEYITDSNGKGRFYLSLSWPTRIFEDVTSWVTHWMPLPEVPNTTLTKEQMRQQDDLSEQREEYD